MVINKPVCTNCGGTGNDGAGVDPLCKGSGRAELAHDAPLSEWVRWIREQPDAKAGTVVLEHFLSTLAPPKEEKAPDTGGKGKKKDD